MKKWQTEKELMTLEPKKIKKSLNLKTLISKIPKIPKIMINIPLNKSNINFQKNHKKIFSNFLTNNSFSISNIENTNPNYLFNSLSYSHRSRIYQKKKVLIPQKIKEEKKKYFFSLKKNLNLKNLVISKKSSKNKVNKTESQKNLLKNSKNTYQTKKYLNTKLNFDKIKLINAGITLDKEINSERVRRININNININLNSINKITNKFEYKDTINNLNSSRSHYTKINDIHFLKRLNFNQPQNISNISNIDSSNEISLNTQNLISDRIKHKQNFIYKNQSNRSKSKNSKNKKNQIKKFKPKIKLDNNKKSKSFRLSLIKKESKVNLNKNKNKSLSNNNLNKKNKKKENEETNMITSESLTILDNPISFNSSFMKESKDFTQTESEKDDKYTVVTTHQINIFLNKAKKAIKPKKLEFKNILFSCINTKFKLLLIKFLDKKSLLVLSSLNKIFYNNLRKKIYKYFYDKIIKHNGNKEFILKILSSLRKYASKILKCKDSKELKSKYETYKKAKSKYDLIILQDISRTFPNEPNFNVNSINYKKLYNILIAYSNFNKNIGYAQGLNFLAARSIIIFKNEEKVFLFLDGLINRFNLGFFLSINNQKLSKQIKYCSQLLNKYCNNFINYLKSKLVNHDFFTTSWLLTLFSNSMDKKKLYICWSFMTIFGWKFFYSFIIQIILFYEKNLIKIDESKLSIEMKELLKCDTFLNDFNNIIKNTLSFMEKNIVL